MIKKEWAEYLFDEYRKCRKFPGWPIILECHDEEDREYYFMLDRLKNIKFDIPKK